MITRKISLQLPKSKINMINMNLRLKRIKEGNDPKSNMPANLENTLNLLNRNNKKHNKKQN